MKHGATAICCLLVLLLFRCIPIGAHEMRPGYLEIRETETGVYDVLWKVPARGEGMRLSLNLRFADDVELVTEPTGGFLGGAHVQRMRIKREGGLAGTEVAVDGLEATFTDVLLRLVHADGVELTHRLTPEVPSYTIEADPGLGSVAWTYFALGVEHILLGIDHLLFVLVLLLLVSSVRKLVGTITAFTVAHSITLALAALGMVNVPVPPVEAAIALSIVFVATEILRQQDGEERLAARRPWLVAFAFGLLHGFGFASALSEIGLPRSAIPMSLFTFNVGVEVGQLLFVAAALLAWTAARKLPLEPPSWAKRVLPYVIGGVAAFWLIQRVAGFWGP